MRNLHTLLGVVLFSLNCCLLFACGSNSTAIKSDIPDTSEVQLTAPDAGQSGIATGWPVGLPADGIQPWETLNAQGYVALQRGTSGINVDSDYTAGRDRFLEGGDVTDLDEASVLDSSPAWSGNLAWAMYRIPMGGNQPGAIGVDANLRGWPTGELSSYYLGVSDYSAGSWDWHGPYLDPHARLSLPPGDYLSPMGNLFVCVLAFNGARLNVVGISVNPVAAGDTTAPDPPAALAATPVAGALLLEWTPVVAADLVGYRVYWNYSPITDIHHPNVHVVDHLVGKQEYLLPVDQMRVIYVRLVAVDVNGNEGTPSPQVQGLPLPGGAMQVLTTTDVISGPLGTTVTLEAYGPDVDGGATFDWDDDGDGIYDVVGDASGILVAVMDQPGIIRPAVRVHSSDGVSMACGAVSLIVTGNTRPVASCTAMPASGACPLTVALQGTAEDAEDDPGDLEFAWDIDGDGIYEPGPGYNSLTPPMPTYFDPGVLNVKFRVTDTEGAWDVDTVAIHAEDISPWFTTITCGWANPSIGNDLAIVDGHPAMVFEDADTNGVYYTRALDPTGSRWGNHFPVASGGGQLDLEVVNGAPAVCYFDSGIVQLIIRRADSSDGSTWGAPAVLVIPGGGAYPSMEIVNGFPGIACRDAPGVSFVRALDANGAAWGLPVLIEATNTNWTDITIVNGNPAVCWTDTTGSPILKFSRADDANGTAFTTVVTVDSGPAQTGMFPSMEMVNGRVAIAYYDFDNKVVWYCRATHANGATWNAPVQVNPPGTTAAVPSLAMLDGVPVIAYLMIDEYMLVFSRGMDADGSAWTLPEVIDNQYANGAFPSLDTSTGQPYVTYMERTNHHFKFARPR